MTKGVFWNTNYGIGRHNCNRFLHTAAQLLTGKLEGFLVGVAGLYAKFQTCSVHASTYLLLAFQITPSWLYIFKSRWTQPFPCSLGLQHLLCTFACLIITAPIVLPSLLQNLSHRFQLKLLNFHDLQLCLLCFLKNLTMFLLQITASERKNKFRKQAIRVVWCKNHWFNSYNDGHTVQTSSKAMWNITYCRGAYFLCLIQIHFVVWMQLGCCPQNDSVWKQPSPFCWWAIDGKTVPAHLLLARPMVWWLCNLRQRTTLKKLWCDPLNSRYNTNIYAFFVDESFDVCSERFTQRRVSHHSYYTVHLATNMRSLKGWVMFLLFCLFWALFDQGSVLCGYLLIFKYCWVLNIVDDVSNYCFGHFNSSTGIKWAKNHIPPASPNPILK